MVTILFVKLIFFSHAFILPSTVSFEWTFYCTFSLQHDMIRRVTQRYVFRFSYISYIAYFFVGSTYHISKLLVPTSREKLFQQHCLFLFFHSEIIPFSSQMYRVCCNNRFPIIHVAIIWHLFACFLIKFHGPFKRIVCFVYLYLSKFSIYYCDINIIVRCHFKNSRSFFPASGIHN